MFIENQVVVRMKVLREIQLASSLSKANFSIVYNLIAMFNVNQINQS